MSRALHMHQIVTRLSVGYCRSCGKRAYRDRKSARQVARIGHCGDHLAAYRCTTGSGLWHIGHLRPGTRDYYRGRV